MSTSAGAEEHLRVIRALMERANSYRALSVPGALVGGLLALGAGVWMFFRAQRLPGGDCVPCTLWVWGIVLALAGLANFTALWREDRRQGDRFFSPRLRWALRAVAPAAVLAGLATWPVAHVSLVALGFLWSGAHGLSLLAASHFAPRSIGWLGRAFFAATVPGLCWLTFRPELSASAQAQIFELYMAGTFGLFHLAYAVLAWPRRSAEPAGADLASSSHV